jgi:hypothetical protein
MAFESTAELLNVLIQSLEWIEVDLKRGGLFDISGKPGEQKIASANQTKWFIDWMKSKKRSPGTARTEWDSNPRYACTHGGFQDRCLKPLGHPSRAGAT